VTSLLLAPGRLPAQRCDEPHCRWSVKTDTALMRTRAAPDDRCAPRSDRERNVYIERGWIRRKEMKKDDGDWLDKQGDLDAPLEVRIVGAAFYDGQHRRTTRKRDLTDGGHGRCNSSPRALWEVYPVYAVLRP